MKNSVLKTTIALTLFFTAFTFASDAIAADTVANAGTAAAEATKSTGIYNHIIDCTMTT